MWPIGDDESESPLAVCSLEGDSALSFFPFAFISFSFLFLSFFFRFRFVLFCDIRFCIQWIEAEDRIDQVRK